MIKKPASGLHKLNLHSKKPTREISYLSDFDLERGKKILEEMAVSKEKRKKRIKIEEELSKEEAFWRRSGEALNILKMLKDKKPLNYIFEKMNLSELEFVDRLLFIDNHSKKESDRLLAQIALRRFFRPKPK